MVSISRRSEASRPECVSLEIAVLLLNEEAVLELILIFTRRGG
jgi:hypothetical protein